MTRVLLEWLLVAIWGTYMWIGWRAERRRRDLDEAVDQALGLTQPRGPEDRDDWGTR